VKDKYNGNEKKRPFKGLAGARGGDQTRFAMKEKNLGGYKVASAHKKGEDVFAQTRRIRGAEGGTHEDGLAVDIFGQELFVGEEKGECAHQKYRHGQQEQGV